MERRALRFLWNPAEYRDLISGRRRGWSAFTQRCGLRVLSVPYAAAMWSRNRWYDYRPGVIHRVDVPVVSVGNLTLGGTGKTPFVAWLARWFRQQGLRVSLVSRGYGASEHGQNDEARELELLLPDVPHLQNPDRVAAARVAIEELETELILLDDGFQHRRLHRDLDIVLIDALEPDGWGAVFPRGTLRESATSLRRADALVLTRADQVRGQRVGEIRNWAFRQARPAASWTQFAHRPGALATSDCIVASEASSSQQLQQQAVIAFCGIGNPDSFRHTIAQCGARLIDLRVFPDHHEYQREDLQALGDWARGHRAATAVVCTQKDLVKIGLDRLGPLPLYALRVAMQPVSETTALEAQLARIAARAQQKSSVS